MSECQDGETLWPGQEQVNPTNSSPAERRSLSTAADRRLAAPLPSRSVGVCLLLVLLMSVMGRSNTLA
eukprot:3716124-Rhodomonas_salina.1